MRKGDREVVHSSERTEWGTPDDLYRVLYKEFRFNFDAAASSSNTKCHRYLTKADNALTTSWPKGANVFLNPPYGRGVGEWVEKAWAEAHRPEGEGPAVVVMLLAARTDTAWFHGVIDDYADQVRFLKGRLKFIGADGPAPFPSMVVVFRRISPLRPPIYWAWDWRRQPVVFPA